MQNQIKIEVNELIALFMVAAAGMMLYRRIDNHEMSGEAAIKAIQFILETAEPGQTWRLSTTSSFEGLGTKFLTADIGGKYSTDVSTEDASEGHLQCFIDVANTVWGGVKPEPSTPLVQDLRV